VQAPDTVIYSLNEVKTFDLLFGGPFIIRSLFISSSGSCYQQTIQLVNPTFRRDL
jgi:hypothetical protein